MKDKTNTTNINSEIARLSLDDFKNSLIIVSVLANLVVLTAWMSAQLSSAHAAQLISLL